MQRDAPCRVNLSTGGRSDQNRGTKACRSDEDAGGRLLGEAAGKPRTQGRQKPARARALAGLGRHVCVSAPRRREPNPAVERDRPSGTTAPNWQSPEPETCRTGDRQGHASTWERVQLLGSSGNAQQVPGLRARTSDPRGVRCASDCWWDLPTFQRPLRRRASCGPGGH